MATTTPNFGWPVPTSTDLVKDGATAIEGLGDAIDASLLDLKGGTSGQVLKKNSNTDMDFIWSADSAGMTNPMTTTGDTIYSSSGSTPARLGIGSTGQVLTVAGGVPSWATPAGGGGAVVQVKSYFNSTFSTTTSTSFVDTNLTINITPTSASNKILVITSGSVQGVTTTSAYDVGATTNIARGGTSLCEIQNYFYKSNEQTGWQLVTPATLVYLDSPATTSSTTYKAQFKRSASSNSAYYTPISITVMEVTP